MLYKKLPELVNNYNLCSYAAPFQHFEISLDDLLNSFEKPGPIIREFVEASKRAIAGGAEIILPGCGVLNMILARNKIVEIENTGVPVMDVSGLLMKMAESVAVLQEKTNFRVSRYGYYKKPTAEQIEATTKIYYG